MLSLLKQKKNPLYLFSSLIRETENRQVYDFCSLRIHFFWLIHSGMLMERRLSIKFMCKPFGSGVVSMNMVYFTFFTLCGLKSETNCIIFPLFSSLLFCWFFILVLLEYRWKAKTFLLTFWLILTSFIDLAYLNCFRSNIGTIILWNFHNSDQNIFRKEIDAVRDYWIFMIRYSSSGWRMRGTSNDHHVEVAIYYYSI